MKEFVCGQLPVFLITLSRMFRNNTARGLYETDLAFLKCILEKQEVSVTEEISDSTKCRTTVMHYLDVCDLPDPEECEPCEAGSCELPLTSVEIPVKCKEVAPNDCITSSLAWCPEVCADKSIYSSEEKFTLAWMIDDMKIKEEFQKKMYSHMASFVDLPPEELADCGYNVSTDNSSIQFSPVQMNADITFDLNDIAAQLELTNYCVVTGNLIRKKYWQSTHQGALRDNDQAKFEEIDWCVSPRAFDKLSPTKNKFAYIWEKSAFGTFIFNQYQNTAPSEAMAPSFIQSWKQPLNGCFIRNGNMLEQVYYDVEAQPFCKKEVNPKTGQCTFLNGMKYKKTLNFGVHCNEVDCKDIKGLIKIECKG